MRTQPNKVHVQGEPGPGAGWSVKVPSQAMAAMKAGNGICSGAAGPHPSLPSDGEGAMPAPPGLPHTFMRHRPTAARQAPLPPCVARRTASLFCFCFPFCFAPLDTVFPSTITHNDHRTPRPWPTPTTSATQRPLLLQKTVPTPPTTTPGAAKATNCSSRPAAATRC